MSEEEAAAEAEVVPEEGAAAEAEVVPEDPSAAEAAEAGAEAAEAGHAPAPAESADAASGDAEAAEAGDSPAPAESAEAASGEEAPIPLEESADAASGEEAPIPLEEEPSPSPPAEMPGRPPDDGTTPIEATFVIMPENFQHSMQLSASFTFAEIKAAIASELPLPIDTMSLKFQTEPISDEVRLSDLGLEPGDAVQLELVVEYKQVVAGPGGKANVVPAGAYTRPLFSST
jgi:hypothetical protein